jgi:nucleotide-binding universal stress UspA family protein
MYRSVLAVIDAGPGPDPALDRAVAEARAAHARLTLLCAVPPPCGLVCFASVCRDALHAEALAVCDRDLRATAERVPSDIPLTTVLAPTKLGRAVTRELDRAGHDVLVIGTAAPSWWRLPTAWRLAHRCPVPVVLVPEPADAPRPRGSVAAPLPGAG